MMGDLFFGTWRGNKESELTMAHCSSSSVWSRLESHSCILLSDGGILWINDACVYEFVPARRNLELRDDGGRDQLSLESNSKIYSPLAHLRISKLFANGDAGIHCAITLSGLLYMWGNSSQGQCGIIKDFVETPRFVPIRTKSVSCVHGQQQDGADVCIQAASGNSRGTIALDSDGHIWQWGSIMEQDIPMLEPQRLNSFYPRKVLDIATGFTFFCAKVQACPINSKDSWSADPSRADSEGLRQFSAVESCAKCREDSELRLSKLMERATVLSSQHVPSVPEEDSKYCPLGLQLKLSPALSPEETPVKISRGYSLMRDVLSLAGWNMNDTTSDSKSVTLRSDSVLPPENRQDIEMQFRMARNCRSRSSGSHFSFVSLDLVPQEMSSSSSDQTGFFSEQERVVSRSSQVPSPPKMPVKPESFRALEPVEVWTWGDNTFGQLGLGDYTSRSVFRADV